MPFVHLYSTMIPWINRIKRGDMSLDIQSGLISFCIMWENIIPSTSALNGITVTTGSLLTDFGDFAHSSITLGVKLSYRAIAYIAGPQEALGELSAKTRSSP